MSSRNPILDPKARENLPGEDYSSAEVALANRNSGIHLEVMRHDITPIGMHYLLSHFDIPYVENAQDWSLALTGLVELPVSVTLEQLSALPRVERTVTLECAGNGRSLMQPRWPSMPWTCEAVGTARWGGARLSDVIELAKPDDTATELVFCGADSGVDGGDYHTFKRSLTLAQIAATDVMLAWEINGQPLPPQHGFPLRLIVPGWFGMASVKWLTEICFTDTPFQGRQQVGSYQYRASADDPGVPVTELRVKSLMIPPGIPDWYTRDRLLAAGTVELFGRAWAGAGARISLVEVAIEAGPEDSPGQWLDTQGAKDATDPDGLIWQPAILSEPVDDYAWTGWRLDWNAKPGAYRLRCRATDEHGNRQPVVAAWDKGGFGNNSVQCVSVWVEQELPVPA